MAKSACDRFRAKVAKHGGVTRVAESLGVSISYVSMLKDGKKVPGGSLAARIQHEYGIPAALWYQAA